MATNGDIALTVNDLAAMLHVRRETIWRWRIYNGLPSVKVGSSRLIPVAGFLDWVTGDGRPDRSWIRERVGQLQRNGEL